jgi:hypothetical protein
MIELQGDAGIIFRDGLIKNLAAGKLEVNFIKKDGSERKMICTRCADLMPALTPLGEEEKQKRMQSNSPDNLPVFDLEAQGWRAFRIDSIKSVAFVLTEIETI